MLRIESWRNVNAARGNGLGLLGEAEQRNGKVKSRRAQKRKGEAWGCFEACSKGSERISFGT